MTGFEKYKSVKAKFRFVYKGIHLNRVLALMIWILSNSKEAGFKWKTTAKLFFGMDVEKMKLGGEGNFILTTFGDSSRREYLQLYSNIISKVGCESSYNDVLQLGHKFSFSVSSLANFVKSFRLLQGTELTFMQKMKLSVHATYYCNTINLLEKSCLYPQKFLCMSHALGSDNLLTQYFRLKNIPTYSLQEGIYFLFGDNPPLDSILYENFETDNLLCWGQYTVDEYKRYGIDEKRFKVSGYPKNIIHSNVVVKEPLRKCLVLLARESFDSANVKLIELLSNFSDEYDFYLKLHPSCCFESYCNLASENSMSIIPIDKSITDCLNNVDYDFAIAVNTTVYYEALMKGLPCLRYHDASFVLMAGLDDVFTNSNQFTSLMRNLQSVSAHEYQKSLNEVLEYSIGYGKDDYAKNILALN